MRKSSKHTSKIRASETRTRKTGKPVPYVRPEKPSPRLRIAQYLAIVVAGLMLWAAYPELNWWILSYPVIALLIGGLDSVGLGRATWYSLLFALAFFIPHLSWMLTATDMPLAWFALAGVEALFVAIFGLFFAATRVWHWCRTAFGEAVTAAVLWVMVEEVRSRIPFGGFAWGKLAYGQVDSPLLAFAPFGGEMLVGFVTVLVSVLLLKVVQWGAAAPKVWWIRAGSALGVLALLGGSVLYRLPNAQQNGSVNVALVQGNVEIPMEETFATPYKVTNNHVEETLRLAESLTRTTPDLVVWGENSLDLDPTEDAQTSELVQSAVDAIGAPTLVGFVAYAGDERYNWVGFWYPTSQENHETGLDADQLYGKQHPVPWGEYVPMREFTSLLVPDIDSLIGVDMASVDNDAYLEVTLADGRTLPIAVGICFEVAYESIVAEGVNLGGELIVIPTNNSRFEYSSESAQQLQMLRFRAAEFSRSAIQVSTNGISGVVMPNGAVVEATDKQVADSLMWQLPLRTSLTLVARLGQVPAYLAMGIGIGLGLAALGRQIMVARSQSRFRNRSRSRN